MHVSGITWLEDHWMGGRTWFGPPWSRLTTFVLVGDECERKRYLLCPAVRWNRLNFKHETYFLKR